MESYPTHHLIFWMIRVFIFSLLDSKSHRPASLSWKVRYGANVGTGRHVHNLSFWELQVSEAAPRRAEGADSIKVGRWGGSLAAGHPHLPVVCPATTFRGGEFRNDIPESMRWLLSWAKKKLCESGYSLWSGSFRSMTVYSPPPAPSHWVFTWWIECQPQHKIYKIQW